MKLPFFLILVLFVFSCSDKSSPDTTSMDSTPTFYEDELKEKEKLQAIKTMEDTDELIASIEFKVKAKAEDAKDYEDGIVPWISLENPSAEIDRLVRPDEIVLAYNEVTLIIDYPLNRPDSLPISTDKKGFTRRELIEKISKRYHEIYEEEEKTARVKTVPLDERK